MKHKGALVALVGVTALAMTLTGCISGQETQQKPTSSSSANSGPIVIGVVMAKTGFLGAIDSPVLNAMEIEVDRVNKAGGINGRTIKLDVVDTASDTSAYASDAQRVISDGANVLMSSCDFDIASPAALVAEAQNMLNFSCASDTLYGPQGGLSHGFTLSNGLPGEASVMAEFAASKGWMKAAFLTDTSLKVTKNQCDIAKKRFVKLGGSVVWESNYNQGDSIAETVSKISAGTAPEVVFNCGYNPGGGQVAKDLRNGGILAPIISGDPMDGDYWTGAVPGLSDYYVVTHASVAGDDPNPDVNALANEYASRFGARPDTGQFVIGAATIQALEVVVKKTGSVDGETLTKALQSFKNEKLIIGPTTFTPELHISVDRPLRIMQITNGKLKFLEQRAPKEVVFLQ